MLFYSRSSIVGEYLQRFKDMQNASKSGGVETTPAPKSYRGESAVDTIRIEWHGPYLYDRVFTHDIVEKRGIYVISARQGSRPEKVVRIGRTYGSFSNRLSDYRMVIDALPGTKYVHIGVFDTQVSRLSAQRLEDVENLLIYAYQPKLNRTGTSRYTGRALIIENVGRRGPIDSYVNSSDYT